MEVASRNLMGNRNFFLCAFATVVLSAFSGGTALAQSTAVLKGTVTDATGAGVPHAKVVAKIKPRESSGTLNPMVLGVTWFPRCPLGITR